MGASSKIIEVKNVSKVYGTEVVALKDINLDFQTGQLTSLLGPSGCGKTTLLKIIAGLLPATQGEVLVNGKKISGPGPERAFVFQDFALLPWATVLRNVAFGLELRGVAKSEREAKAEKYIKDVGLAGFEHAYPHELSGGMRQRVMIAMALANDPQLLIADEPTTALDVTIQAQILDLICDLRRDTGMGTIMITHDLGVVGEVADSVAVMYGGEVVEQGSTKEIFANPQHPYTIGLMSAMPRLDRPGERLATVPGSVPAIRNMPEGCRFRSRCAFAAAACSTRPDLRTLEEDHSVACHFAPLETHVAVQA